MRECTKCNECKPLTEYYKDKIKKGGYKGQCKLCMNTDSRERYHTSHKHDINYKKKRRKRRINNQYNISVAEYETHLESPCDICGAESKHLDHCHSTGKIRGGLCPRCNHMLGHAKDNTDTLRKAIKYLEDSCTQKNT